MKFDFCIGNPPYQEEQENTSDDPIYNNFMDNAFGIAEKVELVTPARFLFNAGKTPKAWNKKMLNDAHFKVLEYVQDSKKYFSGKEISGGVAITYRDDSSNFGAIEHFVVNTEIMDIYTKVVKSEGFISLKTEIYLQNKFNLDELYKDYPNAKNKISSNGNEKRMVSSAFENLDEVFKDNYDERDIRICGLKDRNRFYKYISAKYISKQQTNLDKYKVLLSAADGASGTIGKPVPARIIGNTSIEDINTGYTQTFISIGAFSKKDDAINLEKYLHTKFARFMVGINKVTNGLKIEVWNDVPIQNFTNNSDIDWSKSIHEIDEQLYKKYKLTDKEIEFIETHIKEMCL